MRTVSLFLGGGEGGRKLFSLESCKRQWLEANERGAASFASIHFVKVNHFSRYCGVAGNVFTRKNIGVKC